jgi:hypothetical protein
MKNATDVSVSVQGREPERGPALEAGAVLIGFELLRSKLERTDWSVLYDS